MVAVALTDDQILERPTQRADRFTCELVDTARSPLGITLQARADSAPSLQMNTQRTTFRTMSGLIVENPPSGLNLARTRVRPVVTLANGSRYECGILMFGNDARQQYAAREVWRPELFDENFLLEQDLDQSWTLQAGQSVRAFFEAMAGEVLEPLGIPTDYRVDDVAAVSPVLCKVGTPRIQWLNACASLLAALPPYFANSGYHTLKPAPTAATAPDHVYTSGTRIFDGSRATSSSRYKAPNRYIVVGDDVGGGAVRGKYDLPPAAPNSYFQTGQRVTAPTHTASGVKDAELAAMIAYVDALTDQTTYSTAGFGAAADPRHDAFEVVSLMDVQYLESGWTLPWISGGEHTHDLSEMWA